MTAAELLLDDLARRGVTLSACGDALAYDAPAGVMTPALRAELAAAKAEILPLLRRPGRPAQWAAALVGLVTADPRRRAGLMEWYDERAGILEHDTCLPRDAAEEQALQLLLTEMAAA